MNLSEPRTSKPLESYYRLHAKIYDATRWSFLFGRDELCQRLSSQVFNHLLEVGCGTGKNLAKLDLYLKKQTRQSQLSGLDLSNDMLSIAKRKLRHCHRDIHLYHDAYDASVHDNSDSVDALLFSYSLSMFNPGWEQAIDTAHHKLQSGNLIAVVDFHQSKHPLFQSWMALNHVKMEAHLLNKLRECFAPVQQETYAAYFGLWEYFLFIGKKT